MHARIRFAIATLLALSSCAGRETAGPAGEPSGCMMDGDCPDGHTCDASVGLCSEPDGACGGLACGGSDRGTCNADDTCECNAGYAAGVLDGLCCDVDGSDPLCDVASAPGRAGGLCLAPDGVCDAGFVCNLEQNFCASEEFPCLGFACGGTERGDCVVVEGAPTCTCKSGFDNEQYALYCCPMDSSDPNCTE